MNLFPHRRANISAGVLFGTILMGNYCAYKSFHLQHHRNLNTADDPENFYYPRVQRNRFAELLMVPWIVSSYMSQVRKAGLIRRHDKVLSAVCELCVAAFIAAAIALLWFSPMTLVKVSLIPFLSSCYIQYFVIQAEHFDFKPLEKRPRQAEVGRYAFNLRLPSPIAFLILNTNYHGIHHRYPMTKWHQAPALAKTTPDQYMRGVAEFLSFWFRRGPRIWIDIAPRDKDRVRTNRSE